MSTHDVVGKGRFALLTGVSGRGWADAADQVAATLGIEIAAHVIGPGRRYIDLYDDWARLREVGEDGRVSARLLRQLAEPAHAAQVVACARGGVAARRAAGRALVEIVGARR